MTVSRDTRRPRTALISYAAQRIADQSVEDWWREYDEADGLGETEILCRETGMAGTSGPDTASTEGEEG